MSPGVSPLAMLDRPRSGPLSATNNAAAVVPTLTMPATTAAPGVGTVARPGTPGPIAPTAADPVAVAPPTSRLPVTPAPGESLPEANTRRQSRPGREAPALALNERRPESNVAGLPRVAPAGAPALPAIGGAMGLTRPPADVPAIYRSRLDANRSALARRAGASNASEEAVERALLWLSRHQDADGRWDGAPRRSIATARSSTATISTTPRTAPRRRLLRRVLLLGGRHGGSTGLSLLAYLGAGYTHLDGQYAETVANGLEFLRRQQKPDGDLRGRSQAVGMYCHAMATLALCEAYALTADPKLRAPVERAIDFLEKSRAQDRLAWRYAPGSPVGDTSILGWVVMCLKSAQEVGIPIRADVRQGALTWLGKVASGPSSGLAKYQPQEKVTPTMTAEAWVCRQFLGVGGPGNSSREAAEYLLRNGSERERQQFNLYYLYYGTLAMYQHGGDAWARWNLKTRDTILRRQRPSGHAAGSWDPDESQYGTHGGRIYCTAALATLSLEVYYRYLRLYESPPPRRPRPRPATPRRATPDRRGPRRAGAAVRRPGGNNPSASSRWSSATTTRRRRLLRRPARVRPRRGHAPVPQQAKHAGRRRAAEGSDGCRLLLARASTPGLESPRRLADGRPGLPVPPDRRLREGLQSLPGRGGRVRPGAEGRAVRHRRRLQGPVRQPLGPRPAKGELKASRAGSPESLHIRERSG